MYAENLISIPEAQADFYPTPKELGKKMLQGIDLGFISTVLEPSAGKGDLIRCLAEEVIAQEYRCNPHTLNVDAIEIDPYIRSILKYEFGSARQQEIQHTLRGFEDRTRYDYKLDKEVGLNDEEKTARAQLRYESSFLFLFYFKNFYAMYKYHALLLIKVIIKYSIYHRVFPQKIFVSAKQLLECRFASTFGRK